ncbi:MAG: hypothetical protein ACLFTX_02830 [Thiohalospira sp.]
MPYLANVALAAWLILFGLIDLAHLRFVHDDLIMGVLAVVAGALQLTRR